MRRIILYHVRPGMGGEEWVAMSRIFGWQYIRAPAREPNQNGLGGRDLRSLISSVQSIVLYRNHMGPTQEVLTLAVIAKNRAPIAIDGHPLSFEMAVRFDASVGSSFCMCDHDPMGHDPMIHQVAVIREIPDARQPSIQAGANPSTRN